MPGAAAQGNMLKVSNNYDPSMPPVSSPDSIVGKKSHSGTAKPYQLIKKGLSGIVSTGNLSREQQPHSI